MYNMNKGKKIIKNGIVKKYIYIFKQNFTKPLLLLLNGCTKFIYKQSLILFSSLSVSVIVWDCVALSVMHLLYGTNPLVFFSWLLINSQDNAFPIISSLLWNTLLLLLWISFSPLFNDPVFDPHHDWSLWASLSSTSRLGFECAWLKQCTKDSG